MSNLWRENESKGEGHDTVLISTSLNNLIKNIEVYQQRSTLKLLLEYDTFSPYANVIEIFKKYSHLFQFKHFVIDCKCQRKFERNECILLFDMLSYIFNLYCNTLESLTFIHIDLFALIDKDDPSLDSEYKILSTLLMPLKNLKSLSIEEEYVFYAGRKFVSVIASLRRFVTEQKIYFKCLESFYFSFSSQLKFYSKSIPTLNQDLINLVEAIREIKSLSSLSLSLKALNLQPHVLHTIFESISKMDNLKKLELDVSINDIKISDQLNNLKCLERISSGLKELVFIDDQVYDKKHFELFQQYLSSYKHISSLQLEGLILSQSQTEKFLYSLKQFSNLHTLKLDLSDFRMTAQSLESNFKNLKSILNSLKSLQFILPAHHPMTGQDMNSLIDFLYSQKATLEELNIIFTSKFDDEGFINFLDKLPILKLLKSLYLQFPDKSETPFSISVDGEEGVKNLFDFKQINFFKSVEYQQYYTYYYAAMSALLKSQNQNLETFCILEKSYLRTKVHQNKTLNNYISNNLYSLCNQQKLKKMAIQCNYVSNISTIVNNNKQTLQEFIVKKTLTQTITNSIISCQQLYSLQFHIDFTNSSNYVIQLIQSLPNLQRLSLYYSYRQNNIIDCKHFLNTNYLVEVNLTGEKLINRNLKELIHERKQLCTVLKAYQKLIQPYLIYSPNLSHWDLLLI